MFMRRMANLSSLLLTATTTISPAISASSLACCSVPDRIALVSLISCHHKPHTFGMRTIEKLANVLLKKLIIQACQVGQGTHDL
jgi:hypothetical protein